MSLAPGAQLGSFEIISPIGSGSMGDVYRGEDLKPGRDVAIEVLREELDTDPDQLKRFEQEARSASALNHPNIIPLHLELTLLQRRMTRKLSPKWKSNWNSRAVILIVGDFSPILSLQQEESRRLGS